MLINWKRILLGGAFLIIGIGFHFVTEILLNSQILESPTAYYYKIAKHILALVRNYCPDFIHPLAFILFTGGILNSKSNQSYVKIAVTWFSINLLFEIGQKYPHSFISAFHGLWDGSLLAVKTSSYFINGVFDWLDILAFFLGSLSSIVILKKTEGRNLRP